MISNNIKIRKYKENDESQITTLFLTGDPRHCRSIHYWYWSNSGSYLKDNISVVALYKGNIIAHYSVIGINFKILGKKIRAGFTQQAIVHKDFRNLETIWQLSEFLYKLASERYQFMYGFPNDNFSLVLKRFLKWKEIEVFYADKINLNPIKLGRHEKYEVKPVYCFPESVNNFIKSKREIEIIKDSSYLNWRFFKHPITHYIVFGAYLKNELVGYIVLKIYFDMSNNELVGHFIDYETKNANLEILKNLVYFSKEFFIFNKIVTVIFWNKNIRYESFFNKYIEKNTDTFKTNLCFFDFGKNLDKIDNIENWSFSMANSDAF